MKKKNLVESKIEQMEALIKEANAAIYSALCESNGISDNEWVIDRTRWKAVPVWPMASFWRSIKKLEAAHVKIGQFLDPAKSERAEKWKEACYTASALMKEFEQAKTAEGERWAKNHLIRNIADAIYGVLRTDDETDGIREQTMAGILDKLVTGGKLVPISAVVEPEGKDT